MNYKMKHTNKKECPYCGHKNVIYVETFLGEGEVFPDGRIIGPVINIFECKECKDEQGQNKRFYYHGKPG